MRLNKCTMLGLLLLGLVCGQQVQTVAARPAGDLQPKAAAGSHRELQGLETNAPATPANVTKKFVLEAIAGAAIQWATVTVLDWVWTEVTGGDGYVYRFAVKTSCNDGASTNGKVAVYIADDTGATFKTGYLNRDNYDEWEQCSYDGFETDPQEGKVLLKEDTVCKVYYYLGDEKRTWEPEYVKVYRTKDGDTKSATFCNDNGVLSEEGWYTFSYCS